MLQKKKHLQSIVVGHYKNTSKSETEIMPVPDFVYISTSQHIGAPCTPLVKKGDYVKVGQPIGESEAFVSAPIHASVSGTVKEISEIRSASGVDDKLIVIESDKKQDVWEEIKKPEVEDHKAFVEAIKQSGLVGLGGAAFPTHIKFAPKNLDEVNTFIVNGAECEPFITSDHRLMLEDTQDIIDGTLLIMKYLNMSKGYIGIESNKPDAIEKISKLLREQNLSEKIEIVSLRSRYPQGAERVMIYEITGKTLRAGVLPSELGILLSNVTTVAFVAKYFKTGMPLISKRITVDGSAVNNPKNVLVPIGTPVSDLIEFCGGYREQPAKIIMGGPMMGRAIYSDEMPIVKNNNAILAFGKEQATIPEESACINCGRCFQACPFGLMPTALSEAYKQRDVDALERLQVMQCMECGSCAFVCPARRPLGFNNKLGKMVLKEAGR